jgi:CRP-like cAMP-binding protein
MAQVRPTGLDLSQAGRILCYFYNSLCWKGLQAAVSDEISDIFAASRFFSQVTGPSLDRLRAMAIRRRYAKGERICRQGDDCPGIYVVGSGAVRVFNIAPNGKEHVLHFVTPGMTFLEVAVIGRFACPAWAEATEATTCVLLPTEPFLKALEQDHDLCLQLMGGMAYWVRQLVGLMEDIVLRDAAGRLARYLLDVRSEQGDTLTLPSLKKDLASHLNLTSETFSRTLRRLTDAGLIAQFPDHRLRIADPAALQDVADGMFPEI